MSTRNPIPYQELVGCFEQSNGAIPVVSCNDDYTMTTFAGTYNENQVQEWFWDES